MEFSNIAIIGPGLLGGSIALACRKSPQPPRIHLWARRQEAIDEALTLNLCDSATTDIQSAVREADLIILCTPVETMRDQCLAMRDAVPPEAIITDVGSVKGRVVNELEPLFSAPPYFIGSHPMAGSEKTGIRAATATLFQNSSCILTPTGQSDPTALQKIDLFWRQLGCYVEHLSPIQHDAIMARISHLPHIIASALVNLVGAHQPNPLTLCGNGFKSTTRIASGSAPMWQEILASNSEEISNALTEIITKLTSVQEMLKQQDWQELEDFLASAKKERDSIL